MKKLDKKFVIISIIVALLVVGTITISSYAYFAIENKEGAENVITSGTMALTLTDGNKIATNNMLPGESIEKEFSVTNTGNVNSAYDIYLSEVINTFVDKTDLVYEITSLDGGYNTSNQVQVPSVSSKIINNYAINVGDTHHYKLKITFLNKDENQDDNQGKIFSAKIQINEYKDIETTVNYYLDNELVNTMPNQSDSLYINSSCDKNASIIFDTTNWNYQLMNINQKNTICNMYFRNRYITITYNAGLGSINPTSSQVEYNTSYNLPTPVPPRNHSFIGWYTESTGGIEVDNNTIWTAPQTIYARYENNQTEYDTTGVYQYTITKSGKYKLEVWGAQGGSNEESGNLYSRGGYGGYSVGVVELTNNDQLTIVIGGKGSACNSGYCSSSGGYNGGGNAWYGGQRTSGGGGATHIAIQKIDNGLLQKYDGHMDKLLIVAGGGGGGGYANGTDGIGGSGGGTVGGTGYCVVGSNGTYYNDYGILYSGTGGSQGSVGVPYNSGSTNSSLSVGNGKFGKGGEYSSYLVCDACGNSGGGAGLYGGGASTRGSNGAGGGSGYIGSNILLSSNGVTKHMTCYDCAESTSVNDKTVKNTCHNSTPTSDCAKEDNGYAKITYLG